MVAAPGGRRDLVLLRNGKPAGSFRETRLFFVSGNGARSKSASYQVTPGGWYNTAMAIRSLGSKSAAVVAKSTP